VTTSVISPPNNSENSIYTHKKNRTVSYLPANKIIKQFPLCQMNTVQNIVIHIYNL